MAPGRGRWVRWSRACSRAPVSRFGRADRLREGADARAHQAAAGHPVRRGRVAGLRPDQASHHRRCRLLHVRGADRVTPWRPIRVPDRPVPNAPARHRRAGAACLAVLVGSGGADVRRPRVGLEALAVPVRLPVRCRIRRARPAIRARTLGEHPACLRRPVPGVPAGAQPDAGRSGARAGAGRPRALSAGVGPRIGRWRRAGRRRRRPRDADEVHRRARPGGDGVLRGAARTDPAGAGGGQRGGRRVRVVGSGHDLALRAVPVHGRPAQARWRAGPGSGSSSRPSLRLQAASAVPGASSE